MIRLPDIPLPRAASQQLVRWQAEVDALGSHAARVEAAKRLFRQRNYLYACGPCNGPKNNQFAVFPHGARRPVEVSPAPGAPSRPPPRGEPALIDPRGEDPMAFLMLDLQGTFLFEPSARKGTRDYARADYTRRILRLNRELLLVSRAEAFSAYRARLSEYITQRERGASKAALQRHIKAIQLAAHPTVWREMKRQQEHHRELRALFREAPEALAW